MIMGNDEFILYIRKHFPQCRLGTMDLGNAIYRRIISLDANARKVQDNAPCYWGSTGSFISEDQLPVTAAQIEFTPKILQSLFSYLDELGTIN